MDRRAFIAAFVALWGCRQQEEPKEAVEAPEAAPTGIEAQKSVTPVIGFLGSASLAPWTSNIAAFRRGLNETGYVEDKNVAIEFSWAEGHYEQLPGLASDLVRRRVAVIFTTGAGGGAQAVRGATSTIPIVFTTGRDPVDAGLVASLSHPGGNVTHQFSHY